jgi:hypothetical protein
MVHYTDFNFADLAGWIESYSYICRESSEEEKTMESSQSTAFARGSHSFSDF